MPAPIASTIKARVADLMSVDVNTGMDPKWDGIIADSLAAATAEVTGAIVGRGLSASQVASWARLNEFVTDIAEFWALTKGGLLGNYSDVFIKKIDRREELAKVTLLDSSGNLLVPPTTTAGGFAVASGRMSEADYRFNMDTEF